MRDGGFLTDWNFSVDQFRGMLQAAVDAKVDYFEVGYRNGKDKGPFYYCYDPAISYLAYPIKLGKTRLLVMADAGKSSLRDFIPAIYSVFRGVRVAFYPHELDKGLSLAEGLLNIGYEVFLNPMITSKLTEEHWNKLQQWEHLRRISALYVADSFGSFLPGDIRNLIARACFLGVPVGFHGHNNLQLAVGNSLLAYQCGADFLDGTIRGMGRGAGNAPIEILTGVVGGYNPLPYCSYIDENMPSRDEWGAFPKYVVGGIENIHPYYMDDLKKLGLPYAEAKKMSEDPMMIPHYDPSWYPKYRDRKIEERR
jgi:4-hydroxy 2-oxovalerate aldolase